MAFRPLLLLAAMALALTGCRFVPDYSLQVDELQKDVVRVRVNVATPLTGAEYRQLAHAELEQVLELQRQYDAPLYEVRFEFFAPSSGEDSLQKAATYTWRRLSAHNDAASLRHHLAVR